MLSTCPLCGRSRSPEIPSVVPTCSTMPGSSASVTMACVSTMRFIWNRRARCDGHPTSRRRSKQLLSGPYQSATTVSRSPGHFTPYKCLLVNEEGLIRFYLPEGRTVHARQQIPAFYYRNGVAYAVRREPFLTTKEVIGDDDGGGVDRSAFGQYRRRTGTRIRRLAVAT